MIYETIIELEVVDSTFTTALSPKLTRRFREHERELAMAYVTSLYIRFPDGWCFAERKAQPRVGRTDIIETITFRPNAEVKA